VIHCVQTLVTRRPARIFLALNSPPHMQTNVSGGTRDGEWNLKSAGFLKSRNDGPIQLHRAGIILRKRLDQAALFKDVCNMLSASFQWQLDEKRGSEEAGTLIENAWRLYYLRNVVA
jgi:hypothetical protein